MKEKKHSETRVNLAFGISLGEWAVAVLVGIGSGLAAAGKTIRTRFREELREWPEFKKLYSDHQRSLTKINTDHPKGSWRTLSKEVGELKDNFGISLEKKLLNDHKIHTSGFKGLTKGTWQRYHFMGTSSKGNIVFNSIIGAAVGAGMTLSFFNGVASRDKIEKIEDAVTETVTASPEPVKNRIIVPCAQVTSVAAHDKLEAANDQAIGLKA